MKSQMQPGYQNVVPVKSLPTSLMDVVLKMSGIFHFYKPKSSGAAVVMNAPRPTATLLLTKSGGVNRV